MFDRTWTMWYIQCVDDLQSDGQRSMPGVCEDKERRRLQKTLIVIAIVSRWGGLTKSEIVKDNW